MPILKEGLIYKNKKFFEQSEKPYYCSLCLGSWSPLTADSEVIFDSEVIDTRVVPTISTGWDEGLGTDFTQIIFNINYPDNIIFNRIVLFYGGYQRSKFQVNFNGFNNLLIVMPTDNNPFSVGDRILYNLSLYEVLSVSGMSIGVTPLENSPNLPASGSGSIKDASGIPFVASVLDEVYQIRFNDTVGFILNGTSR